MPNFNFNFGKLGFGVRATEDQIKNSIVAGLWIAETLIVLAICGYAIHRKLKSILNNEDEAKKLERDAAAQNAKGNAVLERAIALAQAKSKIDVEAYIQKKKVDLDFEIHKNEYKTSFQESSPDSNDNGNDASVQSITSWISKYMKRHPLPELPDIIGFVANLSSGIQVAALLNVLSMFGAMCFSKVRALYLDKKEHAPNIQLIIEGMSGSGKDFFMQLLELLFGSIIHVDATNISKPDKIISTIGIDISNSSLHEICSGNQGVHLYIQDPEIKNVTNRMKEKKGLSDEMYRNAFDGAFVTYIRKDKRYRYPLFLNYTYTGTPNDVEEFIKGKEADGNASRIAWASIPESRLTDSPQNLPEGDDLKRIHNKIEYWRRLYCYETDKSGKDVAVQVTRIDLDYVNAALGKWLSKQEKLSKTDTARASVAKRYAAMAFHFAIIIHMMMNEPADANRRMEVETLTLYLADYLIESFLNKFGSRLKESIEKQLDMMNGQPNANKPQGLSDEKLEELIKTKGEKTWKEIAVEYGITEDALKQRVSRYKRQTK